MITSASNPTLKLVRKLLAQKRKREELGLFAVEGEDLIAAASASGIEPIELLVAGQTVEPELLAGISTLAHPARVQVTVHDITGRLVRAIDAGSLPPGRHQATWDARGDDGQRVRAGLYWVGVEVDGRRLASRRLTMLR